VPSAAVAATLIVRLATLWFAVALGAGAWLGIEAMRPVVPAGSQLSRKHVDAKRPSDPGY
jgi:hypothetical protein